MALAVLLANEQAILTDPQWVLAEQLEEMISTTKSLKKHVKEIITAPLEQVLLVLKLLAKLFYGLPSPQQSLLVFYQSIANEFSEATANDLANSFGLAAIAMRAYFELTMEDIPAIRKTLKTAKSYDDDKILVDFRMLSLALVNISAMELQRSKYYKAFKSAYRALEVFTDKKNKRSASTDDLVLEVNIHYLLFQSIQGILNNEYLEKQLREDYLKFLSRFYWDGLELCELNLGEGSRFTKLFIKYQPKCLKELSTPRRRRPLPVALNTGEGLANREGMIKGILESLEGKINPRFDEIRQMIEDYRPTSTDNTVEPKFDLTKQKVLAELRQNSENETVFNLKLLVSKNKERFGRLHITVHVRTRLVCEEMIEENVLELLLSQVCSDDVIPLGVHLTNCTPHELLRFFIVPFVGLDGNRLSIAPKPPNLVPEKKITFLEVECLVLVNYVSDSTLRLNIAPLDECYSMRIDIEMTEELALTFLSESYFRSSMNADIENMYMSASGQPFKPRQPVVTLTIQEPKLHNSLIFQRELQSVLDRLEGFVVYHKLAEGANKKQINIFTSNEVYLKVQMLELGKCAIYSVKNFPWIKTIDTIIENMYSSYGPEGLIKARGYSSYQYSRLQKDFGVTSISVLKPHEQRQVLAMLSKRCSLDVYELPLKESQIKRYGENCIKEVNFQKKVFIRNYMVEDYTVPITICVISLNLEVPVGVRITAYDIQQLNEVGVFLCVQPEMWLRPKSDKLRQVDIKKQTDKIAIVASKEEFKTNYALVQVLQGGGFSALSNLILCERKQGNLALRYGSVEEIKWCRLEEILTWQSFKEFVKSP